MEKLQSSQAVSLHISVRHLDFRQRHFSRAPPQIPDCSQQQVRMPADPGWRAAHPPRSLQSQAVLSWDSTVPEVELSCPTKGALASLHNRVRPMPGIFPVCSGNSKCMGSQTYFIPCRVTCS